MGHIEKIMSTNQGIANDILGDSVRGLVVSIDRVLLYLIESRSRCGGESREEQEPDRLPPTAL